MLPLLLVALLLLGGGAGAWWLFGRDDGTAVLPSASPSPTIEVTAAPTSTPQPTQAPPTATPLPTPVASGPATPTPEPTPQAGDTFAFYEVSVGPQGYTLFALDDAGAVTATRGASFANFSYARAEPRDGADGNVYWETQDGALAGWSYLWPDSGEFRVRAVFLNTAGERRSQYLEQDQLTVMPEGTPAPAP